MDTALTRMTASELATLIASGEASAVEVAQAHLDRIAATEPKLHAFLHTSRDVNTYRFFSVYSSFAFAGSALIRNRCAFAIAGRAGSYGLHLP